MEELKNYTADKTPIEIALGIDENGMTTARKLYEFLELDRTHYSRWAKANIIENEFAEENVDYWALAINGERNFNPNPVQDFKLTAKFAKKLSMMQKNERGEEAREYFTRVEEKVKKDAIDKKSLSNELQMFMQMGEIMARQELEQKRQAEKIDKLESNQIAIAQTFVKNDEIDFKNWANKCVHAIADSPNYQYIGSDGARYGSVWNESYERLNRIRPCRLKQRVESERGRASIAGATQTQIKQITTLSVIETDRDLRPIYESVLREMMIAYCVEVA